MQCVSAGVVSSPTTSTARDAKSPCTMNTLAPESDSWWRRNSPLYAVLIGTCTAPSFKAPKKLMTCSARFSSKVATRSPCCTPISRRLCASRFDARSISRAVELHDVFAAVGEVEIGTVGVGGEALGERGEDSGLRSRHGHDITVRFSGPARVGSTDPHTKPALRSELPKCVSSTHARFR